MVCGSGSFGGEDSTSRTGSDQRPPIAPRSRLWAQQSRQVRLSAPALHPGESRRSTAVARSAGTRRSVAAPPAPGSRTTRSARTTRTSTAPLRLGASKARVQNGPYRPAPTEPHRPETPRRPPGEPGPARSSTRPAKRRSPTMTSTARSPHRPGTGRAAAPPASAGTAGRADGIDLGAGVDRQAAKDAQLGASMARRIGAGHATPPAPLAPGQSFERMGARDRSPCRSLLRAVIAAKGTAPSIVIYASVCQLYRRCDIRYTETV